MRALRTTLRKQIHLHLSERPNLAATVSSFRGKLSSASLTPRNSLLTGANKIKSNFCFQKTIKKKKHCGCDLIHHLDDSVGEGDLLPQEQDEAHEQEGAPVRQVAGHLAPQHLGVRVLAVPLPVLGCVARWPTGDGIPICARWGGRQASVYVFVRINVLGGACKTRVAHLRSKKQRATSV